MTRHTSSYTNLRIAQTITLARQTEAGGTLYPRDLHELRTWIESAYRSVAGNDLWAAGWNAALDEVVGKILEHLDMPKKKEIHDDDR